MIKVVRYEQTCWACPAQWGGTTDDGRYVYVRYRGGVFAVDVAPDKESWWHSGIDDYRILVVDHGDPLDGFMDDAEMREMTKNIIEWP